MTGLNYNAKTDIGRMREDNQDALLACDISFMGAGAVLLAAIDGVGGYAGGDVAAGITVEYLKKYLDGYTLSDPEVGLEQAMISANNQIARTAAGNPELEQMGCVASVCVVTPEYTMYYAHLGDSRLYVYQDGQLTKITHDHGPVGAMEEAGELTEEQAMSHPERNKIYRMLGSELHRQNDGFIEHGTIKLSGDCQLLLCSDGLTDQVCSSEIKRILDEGASVDAKTEMLIQAANDKGGKDNVTVVVAEVKAPQREAEPIDLYEKQNETIKSNKVMKNSNNRLSILAMLLVTIGLLAGFFALYMNQKPMLDAAAAAYQEGRAVSLDREVPEHTLATMLEDGGYYTDPLDAQCIAHHVSTVLEDKNYAIKRLGELNLWDYQIPVLTAKRSGGVALKELADSSYNKLGLTEEVLFLYAKDTVLLANVSGHSSINVKVVDANSHDAAPGVLVRLKEHYYEEKTDSLRGYMTTARDSVLAYAKTDSLGQVCFTVPEGRSYSVLPIREGFQYGKEKGTVRGVLKGSKVSYVFEEREHRIRMFPGATYSEIKTAMSMTVRTPDDYTGKMLISIVLFLLAWWIAFVSVSRRDKKLRQPSEKMIIPILMFISGVGILAQFSMLNPLVDRLIGFDTATTIAASLLVFSVLQKLDVVRWYASDYRIFKKGYIPFDPVMGSTYKPLGLTYVLIAIGLMVLLALAGTSPEGSDAKISLFGWFQPADLCKFLIVIFLAAFFSSREEEIRTFSTTTNKVSLGLQLRTIALVSIVIVAVCWLYLAVLSDMGAGLICLLVFIFMYAVARKDLWQMVLGVVTFVVALLVAMHFSASVWAVVGAFVAWLACWLAYGLLSKKAIYESAIFFNLLIFVIVGGGPIMKSIPLMEHQGQKLVDRQSMTFSGVWDNEVQGAGDQVFLAIKSISSGGLWGQGLGKGHPNMTPAFTTDMVVAGISEQMGYVMVMALMMAYALLAYFGLKAAAKSGHKFVYYFVYGITLATVIQWIIIAGATLGVFCLTGIPAPILAFGKSSLLFHIVAYSLVISASRYPFGYFVPVRNNSIGNRLSALPVCFIVTLALMAYGLRFACFERDSTINRPGFFIDHDGNMNVEYDPRITDILEKIDAGNIYDRNHILLATSSSEMLLENMSQYLQCGIPAYVIEKESKKNLRRYYPFGNHLLFTLGNFNDKSFWSNSLYAPYGLGIENRYFSRLRGFDSAQKDLYGNRTWKRVVYNKKHQDRFLPTRTSRTETTVPLFDYSPIVKLVKEGGNGKLTKEWNASRDNRDITLTTDARLQTILQTRMSEAVAEDAILSDKPGMIINVFIQEVNTGDMLASANYPLPQADTILKRNARRIYRYDESDPMAKAIVLRDGGMTQTPSGSSSKPITALAGMMSYGDAVCEKSYYVDEKEIIERGKVNEPYGHYVNFYEAMKRSSNCYFTYFGLDNDVFYNWGQIGKIVGIRLDGHDGRGPMIPYVLDMDEMTSAFENKYDTEVSYVRAKALSLYSAYTKEKNETGKRVRLNAYRGSAEWWGWFYGQSTMSASPMNMARVVSIIAADGKYVPTRYIQQFGEEVVPVKEAITVVPTGTKKLVDAMCSEAQKHRENGNQLPIEVDGVGRFFSKTGTPERGLYTKDRSGKLVYSEPNDGWYIFGLPCATTNSYLAVAIRMERLGSDGSSRAVKLASEVIIPAIKECGYQID